MTDEIETGTDQKEPEPFNTTMRDQMSAIYDKMDATPEEAPIVETKEPTGERTRGPDGKFIKTEAEQSAEIPAGAKPVEAATPTPVADPVVEGSKLPPPSWSVDAKSAWGTLPPAIQQAVLKREEEVSNGFKAKSDELKGYSGIEQILAPRKQALAASYGSVENAITQLFQLSDYATKDPRGFVQWFAQQRGIDLSQTSTADPVSQSSADPQIAALQNQLSQVTSYLQNQTLSQRKAQEQQVLTELDKFAAAPEHLYYHDVKVEMGKMIESGMAESLQDAYDKATWARSDIRQRILDANRTADEEKRRAEVAKKAAEASRINATNLSSKGTAQGTAPKSQSMRTTMEEVFDRVNAA